jgi:hypothetical protein
VKIDPAVIETVQELGEKRKKDTMHGLLEFILKPQFQNFFFAVGSVEELQLLLAGFIEHGVMPKHVSKRKGKMTRFKIAIFNLTFFCAQCYVSKNLYEIEELRNDLHFFPLVVLQTPDWINRREAPLDCYLQLQDDDVLAGLKKQYYEKHGKGEWQASQALINVTSSMVYALAKALLSYIKEDLVFQVRHLCVIEKELTNPAIYILCIDTMHQNIWHSGHISRRQAVISPPILLIFEREPHI